MPPGQSKVELYAALRRDAREGMSNRALERKYRVGWRTVQKALSLAWPQPREPATLGLSTYGSRLGYPRCRRAVQASFVSRGTVTHRDELGDPTSTPANRDRHPNLPTGQTRQRPRGSETPETVDTAFAALSVGSPVWPTGDPALCCPARAGR
jgi:hypothetical protein